VRMVFRCDATSVTKLTLKALLAALPIASCVAAARCVQAVVAGQHHQTGQSALSLLGLERGWDAATADVQFKVT